MKGNMVETAVGALVVVIAAAFLYYIYSSTDIGKGQGGYRLIAEFQNVEGINVGSDVRMSGIKVGTVVDQKLDQESFQALLTFQIDPTLQLPDDTSAKVTAEGLLGSKFIALDPGGSETKFKDGDRLVNTQGALDLWSLVSDYMFNSKKDGGEQGAAPAETPPAQTGGETPNP